MPAAIASDGNVDLFASFRAPAWHGLGNVFTEEITDYREMLVAAGLNGWDIREVPVMVEAATKWAKNYKAVVADIGNDEVVLGITGERYKIVQNEDAFAFLQSLSDGARWETAGAIKDGTVVFGSVAFDREIVLDPSGVADVVKTYLLVHTSHDGSGAVGGGRTGVRVVCQNTLDMAMGNIAQSFKFRHTATVAERMEQGAAEWRNTHIYFDQFEAEAKRLYEQAVTDKEYFGIVSDLFPRPEVDVKGALSKWEKRQELFSQAWNGKPNAGIKGTGWGALNALTEANQWGRQTRKGGEENFAAAGAGFDGPTKAFRADALDRVLALV